MKGHRAATDYKIVVLGVFFYSAELDGNTSETPEALVPPFIARRAVAANGGSDAFTASTADHSSSSVVMALVQAPCAWQDDFLAETHARAQEVKHEAAAHAAAENEACALKQQCQTSLENACAKVQELAPELCSSRTTIDFSSSAKEARDPTLLHSTSPSQASVQKQNVSMPSVNATEVQEQAYRLLDAVYHDSQRRSTELRVTASAVQQQLDSRFLDQQKLLCEQAKQVQLERQKFERRANALCSLSEAQRQFGLVQEQVELARRELHTQRKELESEVLSKQQREALLQERVHEAQVGQQLAEREKQLVLAELHKEQRRRKQLERNLEEHAQLMHTTETALHAEVGRSQQQEERAREYEARARANQQRMEQAERALATVQRLWRELTTPSPATRFGTLTANITNEDAVRCLFSRRQRDPAGGVQLQIERIVKIENAGTLTAFQSARSFSMKPIEAYQQNGDTILFHGCPDSVAANIQATGLLLHFASRGMLGKGLYGAPDPRKSLQYCRSNDKFMFICRFNLSNAQHAGPNTPHRNSVFDEFCVYDERHVVVLWMIKLA